MKVVSKVMGRVSKVEFLILTFLYSFIIAFLNFFILVGCKLLPAGSIICSPFSYRDRTFHANEYFKISILQTVLIFIVVFALYRLLKKDGRDYEWKWNQILIIFVMSILFFIIVSKGLILTMENINNNNSVKNYLSQNWYINCNKKYFETPLFNLKYNEQILLCKDGTFDRYDLLGNEIPNDLKSL